MSVFHNRTSLVLVTLSLLALIGACSQPTSDPGSPAEATAAEVAPAPAVPEDGTTTGAVSQPAADDGTAAARDATAGQQTARPASLSTPPKTTPATKAAPRFVLVELPAGTELEVELLDTLSSGTNRVGDPVRALLVGDLVADGRRVAPAGAEVLGTVTDVVPLKKFGGQPKISFAFESLGIEDGTSVPVLASHVEAGAKQAGRDAAKIGGGAAAGAVIGHQVDGDKGKEIGALIGGAIGTAVAATTGKEVELPAGTTIVVALETDVRVQLEL